jgi:hypothetical protein
MSMSALAEDEILRVDRRNLPLAPVVRHASLRRSKRSI